MIIDSTYTPEQQAALEAAFELAKTCNYEAEHSDHVTFLAQRLFDDLRELHKLGDQERFLLTCAGVLHDIGWSEGWKGHHKVSLRIILDTPMLSFGSKERLIIGSVARYHRKSLPNLKHDHYAALEPEERELVNRLSALLRLADGLDRTHHKLVRDISCKFSSKKIVLHCATETPAPDEQESAPEKGDLLEKVFKRKLVVRWKSTL